MHSPAQAIAWEICAKNRRALLVAFGLIPFCALGQRLIPPGREMAAMTHAFGAIVTFVSIIWVCSYTANDSRGRFSGFPSWMYTLPLRTSALVIYPMLLGIVLMVIAVVAWEFTIRTYWEIPIEPAHIGWHMLLAVGTLVSVQALIWSLHRFRWIRIVALVTVIYGFLYVTLVGHTWNFSGGMAVWCGGVSLAIPLAVIGAIGGVERDRRGAWQAWTGKLLEHLLDLIPHRRGRFPSPAHAQFWFEWRRKGFFLAAVFGVPLPLVIPLLPLPEALYLDPVETLINFSLPFVLLLIMAGAIGAAVAKSDAWSAELSVHPLVATKPLTTSALLFAKMKSAAAITGLGWVLFCVLSVPAIVWCNQADWPNEQARRFWPDFAINFPKLWAWLSNPVVIVAVITTTWHAMIRSMCVALTGSKRRIVVDMWKVITVITFVIATVVWLVKEPDRTKVILFFRFLPLLTLILFGFKSWRTVSAFIAARRLVSRRDFFILVGLWSSVAVLVLAAAVLAHAAPGVPSAILWFFVALQYFPAGEIPACVVALTRNRHR